MPLILSYYPNYYSINDILATQQRTCCKFLINVPKMDLTLITGKKTTFRLNWGCLYLLHYYHFKFDLRNIFSIHIQHIHVEETIGKLNPILETDLEIGTILEVPIWLVLEMYMGRNPIVQPKLPKTYRQTYQEILKADASTVDLHKCNLYFYEFGWYIKQFDTHGNVHDVLSRTFKTRFRQLLDLADSNCISNLSIQHQLDTLEKGIFKDNCNAKKKLYQWLIESKTTIETASGVLNHKERKRIIMPAYK